MPSLYRSIQLTAIHQSICRFPPRKLIDIHSRLAYTIQAKAKGESWPSSYCAPHAWRLDNSIEDLRETYRLMFPGQVVTPADLRPRHLPARRLGRCGQAEVPCGEGAQKVHALPLIFRWTPMERGEFEERIIAGHSTPMGGKVYLTRSDPQNRQMQILQSTIFAAHQLGSG